MNHSVKRTYRHFAMTIMLCVLAAAAAEAQTPEATPVVDQGYTVTYVTDCEPLGGYCTAVLLQEKAGSSGAWRRA